MALLASILRAEAAAPVPAAPAPDTAAPAQQTLTRGGDAANPTLPTGAATYSAAPNALDRLYILSDHSYYSPPVADPNIPVLFMGIYWAPPVKFTRNARPNDTGSHTFWDVGFGEQIYLAGFDYYDSKPTLPGGLALYLEAGAYMLLDFDAESAAVVDTDYRFGGGVVGRGLPCLPGLKPFGWRYRFFHESTHLGDEFVINALGDPAFARINVSYEAQEFLLSWGVTLPTAGVQVYAAYTRLLREPYVVNDVPRGSRDEFRSGVDFRLPFSKGLWPSSAPEHERVRLIPKNLVLGAEAAYRAQYNYASTPPQSRTQDWNFNAVLGVEWYDATRPGTRLRALLRAYHGANPKGQLRDQNLSTLGLTLQADL